MASAKKIFVDYLMVLKERGDQGVHSASLEDIGVVRAYGSDKYEIVYNRRARKADIVHACDIHPQFYLKLRKGKVSLAMCHFLPSTLDGSISLPSPIMKLFKKYVLSFYRRADHLVTVNPDYVDRLVELGYDRDRVHYIPNCVSPKEFFPLPIKGKVRARRERSVRTDDFVVLSVGQTQPRKGLYEFIQLAEDNPDITFLWAGGFTFGRLTAQHRKIRWAMRNCPPNLRFLGVIPRNRMNELYNACDLYVSTSFDELFPMTVLEAASVGLPILVRDLPIYEKILGDSVMRASDILEFSKAVKSLRSDIALRSQYSQAAQDLARKYSPESVYSQWDELYTHILETAPQVRAARKKR